MNIDRFIEQIMVYGLEYFKVYPGLYRGLVTRNDDPQGRGRIQARVPQANQAEAPNVWIRPSFEGSGENRGTFWPPEVGDTVYVSFAQGNAGRPEVYIGGWYGFPNKTTDAPDEVPYTGESEEGNTRPEKRGMVTRIGHTFIFSDEPDNEYVRLTWHKPDPGDEALTDPSKTADRTTGDFSFMEFGKDGSVQLSNKNGSLIALDATQKTIMMISEQGHSISITEDGINVVDKDGNLISVNKGDVSVVASGNVSVTGATVNLAAGKVDIGSPAGVSIATGESLILNQVWQGTHTHLLTSVTPGSPTGPAAAAPTGPPPPVILSQSVKMKP